MTTPDDTSGPTLTSGWEWCDTNDHIHMARGPAPDRVLVWYDEGLVIASGDTDEPAPPPVVLAVLQQAGALPPSADPKREHMSEDIFQARGPDGLTVDVGWFPFMDPKGRFVCQRVRVPDWDNFVERYETRSAADALHWLGAAMTGPAPPSVGDGPAAALLVRSIAEQSAEANIRTAAGAALRLLEASPPDTPAAPTLEDTRKAGTALADEVARLKQGNTECVDAATRNLEARVGAQQERNAMRQERDTAMAEAEALRGASKPLTEPWLRRERVDGDHLWLAEIGSMLLFVSVECPWVWSWEVRDEHSSETLAEGDMYIDHDADEDDWDYQEVEQAQGRCEVVARALLTASQEGAKEDGG